MKPKNKPVSKSEAWQESARAQNKKSQNSEDLSDWKFTDKDGNVYKRKEMEQKFAQETLKHFRPTIPDRPFANFDSKQPIRFTSKRYPCSNGYRELLTDAEKEKARKAFPGLSATGLEAVLRRIYNMGDERIKKLTWEEILIFCKDYVSTKQADSQSYDNQAGTNQADSKAGRKTDKNGKQQQQEICKRFTFSPGQICFDNKDLKLPTGLTIEMFEKLYKNWGNTVLYTDLDINSDKGEASIQLKTAKSNISKSFRKIKAHCIVENKQRTGYLITTKTRQK